MHLITTVRGRLRPEVMIELDAAPGAEGFYECIGMARVEHTFRHVQTR